MNWKAVGLGALALIALQVFTTTTAFEQVSGIWNFPTTLATALIDPSYPLLPGMPQGPVDASDPLHQNDKSPASPELQRQLLK